MSHPLNVPAAPRDTVIAHTVLMSLASMSSAGPSAVPSAPPSLVDTTQDSAASRAHGTTRGTVSRPAPPPPPPAAAATAKLPAVFGKAPVAMPASIPPAVTPALTPAPSSDSASASSRAPASGSALASPARVSASAVVPSAQPQPRSRPHQSQALFAPASAQAVARGNMLSALAASEAPLIDRALALSAYQSYLAQEHGPAPQGQAPTQGQSPAQVRTPTLASTPTTLPTTSSQAPPTVPPPGSACSAPPRAPPSVSASTSAAASTEASPAPALTPASGSGPASATATPALLASAAPTTGSPPTVSICSSAASSTSRYRPTSSLPPGWGLGLGRGGTWPPVNDACPGAAGWDRDQGRRALLLDDENDDENKEPPYGHRASSRGRQSIFVGNSGAVRSGIASAATAATRNMTSPDPKRDGTPDAFHGRRAGGASAAATSTTIATSSSDAMGSCPNAVASGTVVVASPTSSFSSSSASSASPNGGSEVIFVTVRKPSVARRSNLSDRMARMARMANDAAPTVAKRTTQGPDGTVHVAAPAAATETAAEDEVEHEAVEAPEVTLARLAEEAEADDAATLNADRSPPVACAKVASPAAACSGLTSLLAAAVATDMPSSPSAAAAAKSKSTPVVAAAAQADAVSPAAAAASAAPHAANSHAEANTAAAEVALSTPCLKEEEGGKEIGERRLVLPDAVISGNGTSINDAGLQGGLDLKLGRSSDLNPDPHLASSPPRRRRVGDRKRRWRCNLCFEHFRFREKATEHEVWCGAGCVAEYSKEDADEREDFAAPASCYSSDGYNGNGLFMEGNAACNAHGAVTTRAARRKEANMAAAAAANADKAKLTNPTNRCQVPGCTKFRQAGNGGKCRGHYKEALQLASPSPVPSQVQVQVKDKGKVKAEAKGKYPSEEGEGAYGVKSKHAAKRNRLEEQAERAAKRSRRTLNPAQEETLEEGCIAGAAKRRAAKKKAKEEGYWECHACTLINDPGKKRCRCCMAWRELNRSHSSKSDTKSEEGVGRGATGNARKKRKIEAGGSSSASKAQKTKSTSTSSRSSTDVELVRVWQCRTCDGYNPWKKYNCQSCHKRSGGAAFFMNPATGQLVEDDPSKEMDTKTAKSNIKSEETRKKRKIETGGRSGASSAQELQVPPADDESRDDAAADEKWRFQLEELKKFKRENGHCAVPKQYPANSLLSSWVYRQRREYRFLSDGKPSALSESKLRELQDVGFIWDASKFRSRSVRATELNESKLDEEKEANWESKFDMLKAYKKKTGHCAVPRAFPENTALAGWVRRQRSAYKHFMEGDPSDLTAQKIKRLKDVGFVFDASQFRSRIVRTTKLNEVDERKEAAWKKKFGMLKAFKKKFGHCAVPKVYPPNSSLAAWVCQQRKAFKLFKEGKHSPLCASKLAKLEEIDFIFDASRYRSSVRREAAPVVVGGSRSVSL